jgi:hypothetical protein
LVIAALVEWRWVGRESLGGSGCGIPPLRKERAKMGHPLFKSYNLSAQTLVESHPSANTALGWGTLIQKVTTSQDDKPKDKVKAPTLSQRTRRGWGTHRPERGRFSLAAPNSDFHAVHLGIRTGASVIFHSKTQGEILAQTRPSPKHILRQPQTAPTVKFRG